MAPVKDISNQTFGRLTAIRLTGRTNKRGALWDCVCECGSTCEVVGAHLRSGHTRSCGCLSRELAKVPKNKKHGHTTLTYHSREYDIWCSMKQRCTNPSSANYKRYGAIGISVCERWSGKDGYSNFYEDMGARPSDGHSLDRIDSAKGYYKENCRWATQLEQQNNRSGTRRISYNGETLTSSEWSRRTGIPANTIRNRLDCGWDAHRALTEPVRHKR